MYFSFLSLSPDNNLMFRAIKYIHRRNLLYFQYNFGWRSNRNMLCLLSINNLFYFIFVAVSPRFINGSALCSSVLIRSLKLSPYFSRSTTIGLVGFVRGAGVSACFGDTTYWSGFPIDWAVSLIDPSLLLWSLFNCLLAFLADSLSDFDLDFSSL